MAAGIDAEYQAELKCMQKKQKKQNPHTRQK